MDLFVINRFGAESNVSASEDKNLSKLLSTIEKRKRKKEVEKKDTVPDEIQPTDQQNRGISKKTPKIPKREKVDNNFQETQIDDNLHFDTETPGKRAKHLFNDNTDRTISPENIDLNDDCLINSNVTENLIKEAEGSEDEGGNTTNDKLHKMDSKKKKSPGIGANCEKYTMLGEQSVPRKMFKRKNEREELLSAFPKWLSEPTIIDSHFDTPSHTVDDIPLLAPWLVEKLKSYNVNHFFPVQYAVIPAILQSSLLPPQSWPRDFCVSSPTGSGKTLAFVLPIVQALSDRVVPAIRALVILPTQDLAAQVARVFRRYVIDTPLRVKLLSIESFEAEQRSLCFFSEHKKRYESRVDIVVTTPGRLVEHLNNNPGFVLDDLRYLVVDEADLLIERSQHDWMLHLEKRLCAGRSDWKGVPPSTSSVLETVRRPPHRLYFSATLSHDPEILSKMRLFQPKLFSVAHFRVFDINKSFTAADGAKRYEHTKRLLSDLVVPRQLEQFYVECDLSTKPLQLYQLLMANDWDAVIVFANSVEAVHRLVTLLRLLGEGTLSVAEISSSVSTEERMAAARDFLRGKVRVIVSTDSFARGIDLPNVKCVISYEVPLIFQIYVHRVGRTCRAGLPGCAITLIDSKSAKHFYTSLSFFKKRKFLTKMPPPAIDDVLTEKYQASLKELESVVSTEKLMALQKRKDVKKRRRNQHVVKRLQNPKNTNKTSNKKFRPKKGAQR